MTLFSSFNHIVKSVGRVALIILLSCIVGACHDEDMVDAVQGADTDGSLTFTVEVPGYVVPTRATGQVSIDAEITTLSLFLFDEKGGFMGIVDAEKKDGASIDSGEKDEIYDTDLLNGQGAYQASIPQNTEVVHFIANAPAEFQNLDINRYKGLRAEEVIAPMVTTQQVYWGTSTYADLQQKTFDQEPVILYRNYAKVVWTWEAPVAAVADDDESNSAVAQIVSIDGWTLCNKPQNATVAPFDADAIGETKGPFHFNLADANSRYTCVPMADALMELADGAEDEMVSRNTGGLPQPLPLFDHTTEAYGNKRVFAIFKITTKRGTETDNKTQFYKIELLKDTKENGIVVHREPYDIKRNHIYTINIKGINPDLGKSTFTAAAEGPAANNTLVEVEETLPELQSNTSVLRVENGTVRYIDNLATKYTTTATATIDGTEYTAYNVNDIQIYYNGPYGITAEWVTDSCHYSGGNSYVPETSTDATLKLQLKEQQDVNGRFTHIVSFYADAFAEGDNSTRRYKEGLIRIRETGAGALSRFVRVYIGNPISFRPLLISSDIPAMTDERLTVAFTVPDEDYLPASLYPIEVRFGSDRIDVEKNLYVDAMKVELDQTEDYSYVYQYENMGSTWAWNADADNTVTNNWGYKYAYTIESSKDAGEHRITLRTVSNETTDFSVMMEGLSTVLLNGTRSTDEANIFNTRELRFKVQPETTNAEARRIMLDNGLVDTRLVTAYINNLKGNNSVSIPYTLGQFNPEDAANGYMTQATTINATLWVYYRPDDLTPSGTWATLNNGVPFVDAEGNSFATVTATAATGTLDFTIKNSNLKNSLVFITARSGKDDATGTHPYGSSYTGAALGQQSHVYTGVNADAQAYRSASALVSVLSNWKFNPAVKNEEGTFEYADVYEKKYGTQSTMDTYDFPVRIDRPSGNAATIQIDTEGKLQLIAYPDSPYELLTEGTYEIVTDNTTQEELYRRSIGSTISLTLKAEASNQCELTFRPLTFDHSCTITFTNGTGSTIYDESEKNTLEVTHTPIAIYSNKYMWLDEYKAGISNELVSDALFSSSLNVDPVIGQEYVVRIYFLKDDIAAVFTEEPDAFTFKFSSNCSEVQSPNTDSKTDNYQILADGSIQVTQGFKKTLEIDGKQYGYVDLILKTTKAASSETMRISTAESPATTTKTNDEGVVVTATAANPIKFYRYSVSGFGNRTIYEAGNSAVKYELCTDESTVKEDQRTWVTLDHNGIYLNTHASIMDDLYQKGKTAYLRVTYPLTSNDGNKVDEFTLVTSGFHVAAYPTGATMTVLNQKGEEVSNPTDASNNNGYYWTYKFADVPTTNNSFTLTLTTVGYGLADLMKVNAEGFTFVAEQSQFALATAVDGDSDGQWSISKYNGTAAPSTESQRTGEDHAIFDVGTQINGVPDNDYNAPPGYTHASKMDGAACISFYAPYTGMKLEVGLSQRKNKGGTLAVWYNGQKENSYAANTPTATDAISEFEYTLGAPGLYQLKGEGSEFFLYYLNLVRNREAYSGTIISQWCAKKLNDTQMNNATWGGTGTALTDNLIYLSDFAEKLVLTVDLPNGETGATLILSNTGKYAFRNTDGTKGYSYEVADGGTVELVPASDTDTEIVEGTDIIQLTGYSNNYTYSQNITVKVIPWVQLSTNLYDKYTTKNSAGYPIMQVGDTVQTEFVLTDEQHVGKGLEFGIRECTYFTDLRLISSGSNRIEPSKVDIGTNCTYLWEAVSTTTDNGDIDRTYFQARGYNGGDYYQTDVVYNGGFLKNNEWDNTWIYLAVHGASITYSLGSETGVVGQLPAEKVIIKESDITDGKYSYTFPKNFTLYKEDYTLTGWKAANGTIYTPGQTVTGLTGNLALTPVFTSNNGVTLDSRTEPVTIKWDFQRDNGAPTINGWQGTDGHVWVAQAEVNDQTIDVKMDVNTTNGKFANASWGNWCQLNNGTILTIPSCTGATVEMNAHNKISTTTINGETGYTAGNTINATVSDNDATTDIVIDDGSYYSYVQVTLPVVEKEVNIIPTTDSNLFDLEEMTLLYDTSKNQASAKGEKEPAYREGHLDYMANGDYAEYKVTNTENTAYRISFNTATPLENVTLTFTLYDEAGTQVWSGTSQALAKNSDGDWSTQSTGQILTNYLQEGSYKLKITFNGSSTTANLYSVSFTPIEYKIGLGTWASTVVYEDITVTNLDGGSIIYSSGTNISSSDWDTPTGLYGSGDNATYGSQLGLTDGAGGATIVLNKEIATNNYKLTCRAMKTGGSEGFLIMFDYADDQNRKWWNIGGWSNTIQTVETWVNNVNNNYVTQWPSEKIIASNIWYDITITVQNGQFTGSCVPATIGAPYQFECTFDGTTVDRKNTPVSQDASAKWAFNDKDNYATAYTTTPEGVFSSVSVNTGDLTITGTGTGQAVDENGTQVKFVKLKPAGTTTAVEWSVKPTEGLTFTPTKVTGYIQRFGTDAENGVTVTARLADGTSLELGNFTAPRNNQAQVNDTYGNNSNYTNQFIIELTAEQQETLTSADGFTLSTTVGVGSTKEGGFSDVQIHGTVSGKLE